MSRRNQGPRLDFLEKRGVYYVRWTEGGRSRERSTGTADRAQAEVALAEFLRARTRRAGPCDPAEALVTDILTDYMRERAPQVRAPTRIAYAAAPLAEFLAGRTVAELTPHLCSGYASWRKRSLSTVRRDLVVLRAAVQHAFKNHAITRPVSISLPEEAPSRDRWLTRSEAARLLRAARALPKAGRYLALFVLIGLYTGRRKEAILSLRWIAVDLDRGWIDFRRPGEAETKKRRGKCRIPARLLPHLRRARRFGPDLGYVVGDDGSPVKDVKKAFASAVQKAALLDVSPHVLRHTAASWLMQAGHDPWKVLSMSLTTLLKVYGHHHPDHQSEIAEAFGRQHRPARPQNVRGIR